jgi:hypothetical protein
MSDRHVTPSILTSNNFKEYFVAGDALENMSREVVFSIFSRYMCKAGCQMCYLRDAWIPSDQFAPYIPTGVDEATERQILRFFDFFDTVSTIDDLYLLKNHHPALFEFYVRHAHRMVSTQMSDNAFVQQYSIMMNDLRFRSVYEISFSDVFLSKKNGAIVDDIIAKLELLHARSPILKLKVIVRTIGGETSEPVTKLVEFAHSKDIHVGVHDDITKGLNQVLSLASVDYQETNFFAQDSEPKQVLTEVTYLQYTSVFLTLSQATSGKSTPWFDIMKDSLDDVDHFISRGLQAKIDLYAQYVREITTQNKHYDYFKFVSESVTINPHFNFVPNLVLKPWTRIYRLLNQQGWVETPYGLFDTTCDQAKQGQVIPLYTITKPEP